MWEYKKFERVMLPDLVEMNKENYGEAQSISHLDYIEHEYFHNPAGEALIELAYDKEKELIAGEYIVLPHNIKVNDKIVKSAISLDTLTREQYRGQKIFTSLAEIAYFNTPTREYMPYVYIQDGKPVAFVVSRIREVAHMTTGMIADFLFVNGYEKQAKKLVKFICKKIKQSGAGLAGCIMLSHSSEVKILKKSHFIKCPDKILPQPTPLIIRLFDESLKEKGIMDINNWFFTTGDYDVV